MSPEELKLVEEFNAAVNSAHTAVFSNHLSKQLKDLQAYVDNHSRELEKLSRGQIDNLRNKFQDQLKEIDKNYKDQLKQLDEKFCSYIEPILDTQDDLLAALQNLTDEIKSSYDKADKNSKEYFDTLNNAVTLSSAEIKNKTNDNFKYTLDNLRSLEARLDKKIEQLEIRGDENIRTLLKKQRNMRIYFASSMLVIVFIIKLLFFNRLF